MSISATDNHIAYLKLWLLTCMIAVVLMVFIGGVTRLTESGLSIVEWKLFSGVFPPLTEQGWQEALAEYQTSPESQIKNPHFGITEFKQIYWLEYIHRLMGRITGLIFVLPLLYLSIRKQLTKPLFWRMLGISALVGTQGAIGWVMVASGLNDVPYVSPLKLALHLSVAFTIFGSLLWTYWQLTVPRPSAHGGTTAWLARIGMLITIIQIVLGALVAGNDAGYSYNSYPLMDGDFIPSGLWILEPWWHNITSHIVMVQWQHRMGALTLVIFTLLLLTYTRAHTLREVQRWGYIFTAAIGLQFALGVATLLTVVNLWLASAHQLAALLTIAALLRLIYLTPLSIK
jgi:cytochrome c oxidase assembly protein subunit 15